MRDQHFRFFHDPIARLTTVIPITIRGETTEQRLQLNRRDLRGYRSSMMRRLHALKIFAERGDPEAVALWQEARSDSAEYAAFARSLPHTHQPSHR